MDDSPTFVFRDGMIADPTYVQWLSEVKDRFRQSQIKAAIRVNSAMLEFYWGIGRDLVAMRAEHRWGTGIVKQFALDMRKAFPNATGFSYTNVKYMKKWYSFYSEQSEKGQRLVGLIDEHDKTQANRIDEKGQRLIGLLEMPHVFGGVPWGQHIDIISKCTTLEEALFYMNMTIKNAWSRPTLARHNHSLLMSKN